MHAAHRWGVVAVALLTWSGCDDACVENLTLDCAPLYDPTFSEVHSRTLLPSCGVPGSSCHASGAAAGGVVLDDIDQAYATLVTDGRVNAGDASCSLLVDRLESDDDPMPPGAKLSEPERCSIRQWIAQGAQR